MISSIQNHTQTSFGSVKLTSDYKANLAALNRKNPVKAMTIKSAIKKNIKRQKNNVLFDLKIGVTPKGKLSYEVIAKNPEQELYATDLTRQYSPRWYETGLKKLKELSKRLRYESQQHKERLDTAKKFAPQIASHKPYMI